MQLNMRAVKIVGIAVRSCCGHSDSASLAYQRQQLPPENRVGINECHGKASDAWRAEPIHS